MIRTISPQPEQYVFSCENCGKQMTFNKGDNSPDREFYHHSLGDGIGVHLCYDCEGNMIQMALRQKIARPE